MSQIELEFDDYDLSDAVAKMEAVHNMEQLQRVLDLHNLMLLQDLQEKAAHLIETGSVSAPHRADTSGEGT